MANLKSSKKDACKSRIRAARNKARRSELKTLTKKVFGAVEAGELAKARAMFSLVQSKIARAVGKGVLKANTARRKISVLARRVGSIAKEV